MHQQQSDLELCADPARLPETASASSGIRHSVGEDPASMRENGGCRTTTRRFEGTSGALVPSSKGASSAEALTRIGGLGKLWPGEK